MSAISSLMKLSLSAFPHAFAFFLLLGIPLRSHAQNDCSATVTSHEEQGVWHYTLVATASASALAGLRVDEDGEDVELTLDAPFGRSVSDVEPKRYAPEQVIAPFWRHARLHASVRPMSGSGRTAPHVTLVCIPWDDASAGPTAALQGLASAVDQATHATSSALRALMRARIDAAAALLLAVPTSVPGQRERMAIALQARGIRLNDGGRHADAQAAFAQAREQWQALDRAGAAWVAQVWIASQLARQGAAEATLKQLRPILDKRVAQRYPSASLMARVLHCMALRDANQLRASNDCFVSLMPALARFGDRAIYAEAACSYGPTLIALRAWPRLAAAMKTCLALREELGEPLGLAHAHYMLGRLYQRTGDIDTSLRHYEKALRYAQASDDSGALWETARALAEAWVSADELPKARATLLSHSIDPVQSPQRYGRWLQALGRTALLEGNTAEAHALLQESVETAQKIGIAIQAASARCDLALVDTTIPVDSFCDSVTATQIYLQRGDWDGATAALDRTVANAEERVVHEVLRWVIRARRDARVDVPRARVLLDQARMLPVKDSRSEVTRLRVLARIGFEYAQLAQVFKDQDLARLALSALRDSHQASAFAGIAGSRVTVDGPLVRTPTALLAEPRDSATAAREGEVVVTSASMLGHTFLVVGLPDGSVTLRRVETIQLRAQLQEWLSAIGNDHGALAQGRRVADVIGVAQWWPADARRLLVAAQGDLYDLPWAALPLPGADLPRQGYRPLIANVSVSYTAHAAQAAAPEGSKYARRIGLVEAHPRGHLSGVGREIAALRTDAAASDWSVFDATNEPRADAEHIGILHVAGHHVADTLDAARSALLISTGDQAQKIALPDAWMARSFLVVLAACATADGPASPYVGAYSLARRALNQGARVVLAHRWPVSDLAASRLHEAFYRRIFAGETPEDALANAQRERLTSREDAATRAWASAIIIQRSSGGSLASIPAATSLAQAATPEISSK